MFSKLFILLGILLSAVHSANIVVLIPAPFYSHAATFQPLWRKLAERGHNITLVSPNSMEQTENITQIDISSTYRFFDKSQLLSWLQQKDPDSHSWGNLKKFVNSINDLATAQLTHPGIQGIIDGKRFKCDLMICESYFFWFYPLSAKMGCPMIAINSMDAIALTHSILGNAIHPAIYASPDLGFEEQLSFRNRLQNTLTTVFQVIVTPLFFQHFDSFVREHIGKEIPTIEETHRSVSLLLTNANPIFYAVRPSTPITINVGGGLHLEKSKPLPENIQHYLDQSTHGCIYFSFGSTVNSNNLSPETIEIFRETFEELDPIRILWKYENETLVKKPKNLEIKKWFPQQDVLRHPNVKLFITQGGLQSMEEAVDSAVPMLGIPFYGDQISNVKRLASKKLGVSLDIDTLNKESLKKAILEVINNPIYKTNINRWSAISKDEPMTRLEKAVWWIEYVLRHGGTEHLRSPSADIPLYQYFFLDIIAFTIICMTLIIFFIYYSFKLIRFSFRKLFASQTKEKVN